MISIELATGRVRPLADKGLLDPPSRFPPAFAQLWAWQAAKRLQFVLVPTLNGVENLPG